MIFKVCMLGETSGADVTLIWPGAAVHVHVRLEVTGSRERLRTQVAFMWFFLSTKINNVTTISLIRADKAGPPRATSRGLH